MGLHDRILVTTDLTAHSDRALDRGVLLARGDGANLVVLHVIDPLHTHHHDIDAAAEDARSKLAYDLGAFAAEATIRIEVGHVADVIERVARDEASTLVVAGVARAQRFGGYTLGSTVDRLIRTVHPPLLLVSERPRGAYERVAVTTDFSPISRQALELTVREFPYRPITVFHAYEPLAGYGASNIELHRQQRELAVEIEFLEWLNTAALPPRTRGLIQPRIVFGEPAKRLRADAGAYDLVVIATHGRGRLFEFFVGSVARRMLAQLPCDALLLRIRQVAEKIPVRHMSELT